MRCFNYLTMQTNCSSSGHWCLVSSWVSPRLESYDYGSPDTKEPISRATAYPEEVKISTDSQVIGTANFECTIYNIIALQSRVFCNLYAWKRSFETKTSQGTYHGHDVSAFLCESVNSVGVVKSRCTLYIARLEYHTVEFKIDYTYTKKYPDPNVATVAL